MGTALPLDPQKKHEQLLQEQKELAVARDDSRSMTEQFKQRSAKLVATITRDQQFNKEQTDKEMVCCFSLVIFSYCFFTWMFWTPLCTVI